MGKKKWGKTKKTANILAGIGAVNWGLVALLNLNLVTGLIGLFGSYPTLVTIVYSLVGVSGIFTLLQIFGIIKK